MPDAAIPDLILRGMTLSRMAEPIDLGRLLYRGGASLNRRLGKGKVESGQLGKPLIERLPLLTAIHHRWQSALDSKLLSDCTIENELRCLKDLVALADRNGTPLTICNAKRQYLAWAGQIQLKESLNPSSKYTNSMRGACLIAPVVGMPPKTLQWKTRIPRPTELGNKGAKENLEATASFVQTLLQTIEQLAVDVIRGPLPVILRYEPSGSHTIHCRAKLKPLEDHVTRWHNRKAAQKRRERLETETCNKKRAMLINLRLEAELLVFINQTGSNLTQALRLAGSDFRYRSDGDYLVMYVWKNRARHDVDLRIHKAYRSHFQAYLKWRADIFPDDADGLTFPFVYDDGEKSTQRTAWDFRDARLLLKAIGRPFVPPRQLRVTIANFVKRKVSRSAAAELLSNSEVTFRQSYEEVHHQRTAAELTLFWGDLEGSVQAVGPGECVPGNPKPRNDAPNAAPKPDCESGAGCLFCESNRDLPSFDHAWNLTSMHRLKLAEFNADRTHRKDDPQDPVQLTLERISAKLDALAARGGDFAQWVLEARLRVDEGRYHPFYTSTFGLLESAP